jgi:hypothetical protein
MGWRVNLFLYRLGRAIGWEEDYSDCWLFSIVVIVPDLIFLSVTVFKTVFCFPVKTVSCFQITPKYVPKFHRKQFSVFNKPKTVFCFQQNSFLFSTVFCFLTTVQGKNRKMNNDFFLHLHFVLANFILPECLSLLESLLDKSVTHLSILLCLDYMSS